MEGNLEPGHSWSTDQRRRDGCGGLSYLGNSNETEAAAVKIHGELSKAVARGASTFGRGHEKKEVCTGCGGAGLKDSKVCDRCKGKGCYPYIPAVSHH